MSAPKPYETRPDDLLIESPELPGLFWNMRTGLVCNKDGKLLTISPSAGLTNEPPSGTHIGPDGKQYWNAACPTDDTMLTNDPQAGYVAEQREPKELIGPSGLTAKRLQELCEATGMAGTVLFSHREMVRRVIDGLITSGELMVSKTVNVADLHDASYTELTGFMQDCKCGATLAPPMNFCPGCGSKIVE